MVTYPTGVKEKLDLESIYEVIDDLDTIKEQDERTNALSLFECPFCESSFEKLEVKKMPITTFGGKHRYYVHCKECDAGGSRKDTAKQAVEAWNRE